MNVDGILCVLGDANQTSWSVWLCRGVSQREHLGKFAARTEAVQFAIAEEARREKDGLNLSLHLPDDCPCYGRWEEWQRHEDSPCPLPPGANPEKSESVG